MQQCFALEIHQQCSALHVNHHQQEAVRREHEPLDVAGAFEREGGRSVAHQVKDRDPVPNWADDRIAIGREDQVALRVHQTMKVGELSPIQGGAKEMRVSVEREKEEVESTCGNLLFCFGGRKSSIGGVKHRCAGERLLYTCATCATTTTTTTTRRQRAGCPIVPCSRTSSLSKIIDEQ